MPGHREMWICRELSGSWLIRRTVAAKMPALPGRCLCAALSVRKVEISWVVSSMGTWMMGNLWPTSTAPLNSFLTCMHLVRRSAGVQQAGAAVHAMAYLHQSGCGEQVKVARLDAEQQVSHSPSDNVHLMPCHRQGVLIRYSELLLACS